MYKIIREDGGVIGQTDAPVFVMLAPNGCFNLCPERDAQGISFAGEVYHLFGRDKIGKESVMLERVDSGPVLLDMDSRLADTDAMTVDQEYRITLLELGITDGEEV